MGAAGAAIVGGTASVLGGGKFANGAQTAMIQYLFNQATSKRNRNCAGRPCGNRGSGKSLWKFLTGLHYEVRYDLNSDLPLTADEANAAVGTLLPENQSVLHDNGIGDPEKKYIFNDGREAVYDGDTNKLITDPEYGGTYNYINPKVGAPWYHPKNIGHGIADVISYCIGGNNRAGAGPSCL